MFLRPGIPPACFTVPSLDNDGVCCSVGIVIADVDVDAATAVAAVGRSESSLLLLLLLSSSSLLSLYGRVCPSSSPSCTPWNGSSTLISRTVNVTFCNTYSFDGRQESRSKRAGGRTKKERRTKHNFSQYYRLTQQWWTLQQQKEQGNELNPDCTICVCV